MSSWLRAAGYVLMTDGVWLALLVPVLANNQTGEWWPGVRPAGLAALVLVAGGLALGTIASRELIVAGDGTPLPVWPTKHLVESGPYGKGLVLDGKWQSCTGDEFMYHEPLVHPACTFHRQPKDILILGGAEGATLREALKWNTVERCRMVDIDGEVVAGVAKLTGWHPVRGSSSKGGRSAAV